MRRGKLDKKKTVPAVPKNRTLDDMQRFYRTLDLAELWQDFFVSIDSSGRPKYKSARHFARHLAENDKQREFLTWLFGPAKDSDPQMDLLYPFAKPLDFDYKRETGGWYTEENLRTHSKAIREELNALEALRAAGNGITLNSLSRMENMARQLDKDFGGRFMVDGLSMKENMVRARFYVMLQERLLKMIGYAQDIYAKSHGINFQDMSGFERLLAANAITTAAVNTASNSRVSKVLNTIVEMALEKAVTHGLPLPKDVTDKVVIEAKKSKTNVM